MAEKLQSPADLEKLQKVESQKLEIRTPSNRFSYALVAVVSHLGHWKSAPLYAKRLSKTVFQTKWK